MPHQARLRITHVAAQLDVGGMEKLLVEFARHADRQRFDLRFVSLGARGALAGDLEALGWPVFALERPAGVTVGLIPRLASLFCDGETDVVHTHNSRPLIYGGPAAWLARVPGVVHTRHGRLLGRGKRLTSLFRSATRLANRIVCVSHDSARLSLREGVAPNKVRVIWNGIDVSRFDYTGPRAGSPVIMVGRLSPEKGVDTLLKAVALVVRDHPAFRLQVAGDGVCLPALREQAAGLRLNGNVDFLGERRDVPALLAQASAVVLPSYSEGISLALLEAMARGLPVVATRVGGNAEVVADGETGFVVPARSPEALADALVRLHRDPQQGRRMGEAGRRRVERHFDVRQMVREYEALYEEASRSRGRRPLAAARA